MTEFLVIAGKMTERKISRNGSDEEQGEPSNSPADKVYMLQPIETLSLRGWKACIVFVRLKQGF